MSRIGKQPVEIPDGVTVELSASDVTVKGNKGELKQFIVDHVKVEVKDGQVLVSRVNDEKVSRANHGLMRSLIQGMVIGVKEGYSKKLEVTGVGFKSNVSGKLLKLSLGFSHEISYTIPEGIELEAKENIITVSGIDKQLVGNTAAEIRAFKKPEPYKGKGIKYEGEYVIRKAGKAAGAGAEA